MSDEAKKYGYRKVWYDARKKRIHSWGWDEEGNRVESVEPFHPYLYIETLQKTDAISIYGDNLKKITFPSQFERRRYVKDCGIKRLFFNHKAEQQYLLEKYLDVNESLDFSSIPIKIAFLDIEVYAPDKFPVADKAEYPINLLTFYDSLERKFHAFGIKHYTPEMENVTYYHCANEFDLLNRFLEIWSNDYPDVMSGWNSDDFDVPYIVNRINKILGADEAAKLSPVGSIYYKEDVAQKFGKSVGKWVIHGLNCIDYMEIYQKYSREKRESYKLGYIGYVEKIGTKNEINATSLAVLSEKDWKSYVNYNIQDVNLLVKLEDKLRFLQTMRLIAQKGFCNIQDTLGKVMVVGGAVSAQALKRNKILCTFEHDSGGDYKGGFVQEIESCLKENVVTFDANSLYPNVIITLNISPETKVGNAIIPDTNIDRALLSDDELQDITIITKGKTYEKMKRSVFRELLKTKKLSLSKANIIYTQQKKGIVPEFVDGLYAERVDIDNKKNETEKELLLYEKGTEKYNITKRKMEQYDLKQYTLKILLNSIYGVFANRFSPLYDIDSAASITLTGQSVIKESSAAIDKYASSKYGIQQPITHYNDTDSCHCQLSPMLDKLNHKFMVNDVITPGVYALANELNDMLNDSICEWAKKELYSIDPRFYFKREAICSAALYQSKKHYILHIKDKGKRDPLPCDIIKPVGIEMVKSTMSEQIKNMIKRIVEALLITRDREKTLDIYRKIYDEFNKLTIDEISFRSAVKMLDKYSYFVNHNGQLEKIPDFQKISRTPVAVAGSLYHNSLINKLGLTSKYEMIKVKDRVKWAYCNKNNKFNIHNIAYLYEYPKEFEKYIEIDYNKMFKKIVEPSIKKLFEAAHWPMINVTAEYRLDLLDYFK
jgi:DNA polymerase elongation subunit (family B)